MNLHEQLFKCRYCPAKYTSKVNVRAREAKMHPAELQMQMLTNRELLNELSRRCADELAKTGDSDFEHLKTDANHLLHCLSSKILDRQG